MTAALVAFLRARLAEDKQTAQAAVDSEFVTCGQWDARGPYGDDGRFGNIQSEHNEQIVEEDLLWPVAEHIARHDPGRVLAEVEAKLAILAEYEKEAWVMEQGHRTGWTEGGQAVRLTMLRLLAAVYREHPEYDPAWAPDA